MKLKSFMMTIILVLAFLICLGCESKVQPGFQCNDPIGCIHIASHEPIKIAALQVLSGDVQSLGIDQVRVMELAIADRQGQILGHPLEINQFDEMCSKEGGRTGAQRIVSDPDIVAVFGTTCSGAAGPAMETLSKAGYAMISGANTAPSLTSVNGQEGPDHYTGYFRTSHNDEVQGRAAATYAYRMLKHDKAATLHDGDAYTKGLVEVFQDEFEKLGGKIVIGTEVNKGDKDMRPVLSAVAESGAKLIFFPLFQPEGDHIVKQARKMPALQDVTLMSADGLMQKTFLESVADVGIGMYFVGPAKPEGAGYDQLVDAYVKKNEEHPIGSFHAHGYDAANILINAIEQSAVKDTDNTLHIGRQAIRTLLQATPGYHGLTGVIRCDQFGDCSSPKINILRLDDPTVGFEGLRSNVQYTYSPLNDK